MSAVGVTAPATALQRPAVDPGRPFVSMAFDYLVIGGGLSLVVLGLLYSGATPSVNIFLKEHLWTLVLLSNSAHFAGSTVRLYTRAGSFRDLPFLTMGLPLVTLGVLLAGLALPGLVGQNLLSLYLTWSPYHYSAQAYGIAVLYCHRSGAPWDEGDKKWLRLSCFAPFLYAFLTIPGAGLAWIMPTAILADPMVGTVRGVAAAAAQVGSFAGPLVLFARHQMGGRPRLPLVSLLAVLANAIWLVMLNYQVLVLAAITVFHGLQYLAISRSSVKERTKRRATRGRPGSTPPATPAAWAWGTCSSRRGLRLRLAGFSYAESLLMVVTVINIHTSSWTRSSGGSAAIDYAAAVTRHERVSAAPAAHELRRPALDGPPFLHASFDYLVIGGGLSILVLAVLSRARAVPDPAAGAEHVGDRLLRQQRPLRGLDGRLYTKPGTFRTSAS